jgi:hypothetical protein
LLAPDSQPTVILSAAKGRIRSMPAAVDPGKDAWADALRVGFFMGNPEGIARMRPFMGSPAGTERMQPFAALRMTIVVLRGFRFYDATVQSFSV